MSSEFPLFVSYGQIVVFAPSERLFNDWTREHTRQGFAWREGSVSFGVPDHDGSCWVELRTSSEAPTRDPRALRQIVVPFDVREASLMIGSVTEERGETVEPGRYALSFTLLPPRTLDGVEYGFVIALAFHRAADAGFHILKADDQMSDTVLVETAAPPYQ